MPFLSLSDVELEYRTIDGADDRRWLVFLHEGLGSVQLWKGFPDRITRATGHPALVYSREGHGWSSPRSGPPEPDFMHREALEVLPSILDQRAIQRPILVGHSDGASIALIHAAHHPVTAVVAMAPHTFVEAESLAGIDAAARAFHQTDLPRRMARYHDDPESTFRGWHGAWTHPDFRDWSIRDLLPRIHAPLLLVQGADDQYGTEAQIATIEEGVSGPTECLWLEDCGHSPHLERSREVEEAVIAFVGALGSHPLSHD